MKENDVVEALLDMGLKKGRITYEEINNLLPPEIIPVERIAVLMDLFYRMGIRIVDFEECAI